MFLDESGFTLVPTVRKTWAPRGQTPILQVAGKWTKISSISAISVSPGRKRIALYIRFRGRNIRALEVAGFLRHLLRHLRKGFVLLWDSGAVHKARLIQQFLKEHPSIWAYSFPGYAPELNPDEFVWANLKRSLANSAPKDTRHLKRLLRSPVQNLKRSKKLLWSCIKASELPWN